MLLRALGTKQDARYNLKIVNTDDGGERRERVEHDAPEESNDERESVEEDVNEPEDEKEAEEEADDEEETSSELTEQTRAELADLDDLDI